jgi:hypothetical protein
MKYWPWFFTTVRFILLVCCAVIHAIILYSFKASHNVNCLSCGLFSLLTNLVLTVHTSDTTMYGTFQI